MAIALDGSSPAAVYLKSTSTPGVETATTAAFSPPGNTLIVVALGFNAQGSAPTPTTPTNTGTALSWSLVKSQVGTGNLSAAAMYQAWNANSQAGITITSGCTGDGNSDVAGTIEGSLIVTVWTGAKSNQAGQATASGLFTASGSNTGAITSTVTGSQCIGVVSSEGVNPQVVWTSTDNYIQSLSTAYMATGAVVYKSANNGAPGTVNLNYTANKANSSVWIDMEILPPSGTVYTLPAALGSFSFVGANNNNDYAVAAQLGSMALTGNSVNLNYAGNSGFAPNVVGLTLSAGLAALQGVGVNIIIVVGVYSITFPKGNIVGQYPPAGTLVGGGAAYTIYESLGPSAAQQEFIN